jgi:DNA end-binding protein Ku
MSTAIPDKPALEGLEEVWGTRTRLTEDAKAASVVDKLLADLDKEAKAPAKKAPAKKSAAKKAPAKKATT